VIAVLACAGMEWGAPNLTDEHLARMRVRLDEFVDALRREDVTMAGTAGADLSTIATLASGNRELQTHVDLVVARTMRLLALTAERDVWQIWIRGYRETLELRERDAAVERYRRIYAEYRARVETLLFDEESDLGS
jgi:DNA-binding GntR family transcriptional regulator